jgi:ubiquinone/menaquinone biosynthesis C-methylase UbiE
MTDFTQLKERQAAVWSAGAFEEVAETLTDMHVALVEAVRPQPGERLLDIGCGSGNAAELACSAGARVTGIDLSPRLVDVAKRRADAGAYDVEYAVGDAEALAFTDGAFDVAISSVGLIFAPDHARAAAELARVLRPGGRFAISAWTPEGTVGEMFKAIAPFQPPLPEGAGTPLQWGSEDYARAHLEPSFDVQVERRLSRFEGPSLEESWERFSTKFGPTRMLLDNLPPEARERFEQTMLEHFGKSVQPDGRVVDDREYLLISGVRK